MHLAFSTGVLGLGHQSPGFLFVLELIAREYWMAPLQLADFTIIMTRLP